MFCFFYSFYFCVCFIALYILYFNFLYDLNNRPNNDDDDDDDEDDDAKA